MARPRKTWIPKKPKSSLLPAVAVGYVRVSTQEQKQNGLGLDAQVRAISDYCNAAGMELTKIYRDEGLSGTLPPECREGLRSLMADMPQIPCIVVKALDRIGRRPSVAHAFFEALDASQTRFVSITEPDLSSELLRGLFAGIAADERRRILDRTMGGKREKALQGGWPGGRAPYGYRLTRTDKGAKLEIVPEQAEIVRWIYTEREKATPYALIVQALNALAVPAPLSEKWSTHTIHTIANNPIYKGYIRYRLEDEEILQEGTHEPIIF